MMSQFLYKYVAFSVEAKICDIFGWTEKEFEDTKEAIRIRISKKNRQHNGQKKKYKRTNNDLQNIHIKLKIE
jgi:adenylate cyclase class IV